MRGRLQYFGTRNSESDGSARIGADYGVIGCLALLTIEYSIILEATRPRDGLVVMSSLQYLS